MLSIAMPPFPLLACDMTPLRTETERLGKHIAKLHDNFADAAEQGKPEHIAGAYQHGKGRIASLMTAANEPQTTLLANQPLATGDEWRQMFEALQLEHRQMLIVAQVSTLVVLEHNYVRRLRMLARAAAAVGAGRAILFAHDVATHELTAIAVMDGLTGTGEPFMPGNSGITAIPQLRALALGEGVAGMAAQREKLLLIPDLGPNAGIDVTIAAPDAEILSVTPLAIVAVPLIEAGTLVGVLEVAQATYGRGFDPRTVELLQAIGAQATLALAIEVRERNLRLERIQMIEAQESERRRLARDLNDGPAHGIASAVTTIEAIDSLITQRPDEARSEIRRLHTGLTRTMRDIRSVLFDLRPFALETDGLALALHNLAEHFKGISPLHMRWIVDLPARLPYDIEATIYVVVREALTNVVKHAQATACLVEVRQVADSVKATIRDNGEGFDPDIVLASYPRGQSWGLLNMYEHTRPLTERFTIRSRPEQGTVVELEIPLPPSRLP